MFLLLCLVTSSAALLTEDYCWRDYNGHIPSDAFPAGLDRNGNSIYLGQTLYSNLIIPGKILKNDNNIYFEWAGNEVRKSDNVKIFCTNQPQKFEWITTEKQNLLKLINELEIINGGFEPDYHTFMGRALSDGETLVGKVVCRESNCLGLLTTKNGKTREHNTYQLLTYNSKKKNLNKCININFY
ncbi:hypothetical protein FQR65_LT00934 [Abscondita terminalis]|nr:hypothetical protein FQR65_LT00934 [Abscondita terminalis]